MIQEITTTEEFNSLIQKGAVAIDVRTEEEFSEKKIPHSLTGFNWNSGEFHDNFDQLDPAKTYILVCRSGSRSLQACLFLQSQGFQNVYNLHGGMMNWQGDTE